MATGGRFSQTNNGRMFICGRPHLGRSACLPLSPDRGIGVFVLAFPGRRVCLSLSSPLLYFFVLFSGLQCCANSFVRARQSVSPAAQHLFFQPELCSRFDPVRRVCCSLFCVSPVPRPGVAHRPRVQRTRANPTHNSAMVTGRMKTSASWQQINGSLSPRISRTLNKI